MNGYISKKALMEYTDNQESKSISNNDIARFPIADVVEVVRCKDCYHSRPLKRDDWFESLYADHCIWCMRLGNGMRKTDFCSDGERRSE